MATKMKEAPAAKKAATTPPAGKGKPAGALATVAPTASELATMGYEADSGAGMEGVDSDSIAIPFLTALQKMSPQCDPDSSEYNPDARPGMLYNTVTRETFADGLLVIPCAYRRTFIKWGARKTGGGFKGSYDAVTAVQMRDSGKVMDVDGRMFFPDENGNVNPDRSDKLADTREHYVIVMNPKTGQLQQAVMSLKSTQIKKSKMLMAQLAGLEWHRADGSSFHPASFAVMLQVTTVSEENAEGTWSGYRFELAGRVSDPKAYATAKSFHALVSSGQAVVDHSKDADTVEAEVPAGGGSRRNSGGKF